MYLFTVEKGYRDYHLVTKIGYCDYFALQFSDWTQMGDYQNVTIIGDCDYFVLVPR